MRGHRDASRLIGNTGLIQRLWRTPSGPVNHRLERLRGFIKSPASFRGLHRAGNPQAKVELLSRFAKSAANLQLTFPYWLYSIPNSSPSLGVGRLWSMRSVSDEFGEI